MKRHLAYQLGYVIATLGAFAGSAEAAGIGTIEEVVNQGYRTPPGQDERSAQARDEVVQDEALRTEEDSAIQVRFQDGSQLSVESASEAVLSAYVFDGSASAGLINLNDGLFHFTSNGQDDQGLKLKTPVATIGIRGTEFLVHVDGDDATIIDILSGSVEAVPAGDGKPAICIAGQSILVAGADEDALCGAIGSFSTAAGERRSHINRPEPGHGGDKRPDRPERSAPDPDNGSEDGSEGGGSQTFLMLDCEHLEWDFG